MSGLVINGATYHRKDNTSGPQGGSINYARKLMTGRLPLLSTVQLVGSDSSDINQIYLIEGIGETRAIETELVRLNGAGLVSTTRNFLRLYNITKQSGDALTGNVTVCASQTIIGVFNTAANSGIGVETTELINFLPNAQGRATVDSAFYEKFFIRNDTGSIINQLTVKEHQSDFDEEILFARDTNFNSNTTARNRLTKPDEVHPGDLMTDSPIVITNMPVGASIGIWIRILIPAGEATVLESWKIRVEYDSEVQIFTLLHPEGSGGTFTDVVDKRYSHPIGGGNPLRYIELAGAKFVEESFYEPDPVTFRDQFYYNTRLNVLFKKISTKPRPVWKRAR